MRRIAVLSAAVMFVPVLAWGQFRVGSDGQAMDANTRLGSNGYNANSAPAPYVTGNQIITGNVTGLGYFHGGVPYTDPSAFRGQTGSSSFDPFLRQSTAAPLRGAPPTDNSNQFVPQAFYGGQTAAPPPGYTRDPYSGTYLQQRNLNTPGSADINYAAPPTIGSLQAPPPGTNFLIGAPGVGNTQTIVAPMPSGGVAPWQPDAGDNQYFLARSTSYLQDRPDRKPMDDMTIQRMRNELQQTAVEGPGGQAIQTGAVSNSLSDLPQPTNSPGVNPTGNLSTPGEKANTPALTPLPLDGSVNNKPANVNQFATNQSVKNVMPTAAQQSSQLAELQRRLDSVPVDNAAKLPDVTPKRLQDGAFPNKPIDTNVSEPTPNRATPNTPSVVPPAPAKAQDLTIPAGNRPEPMKVESLATGFRATGLQNQMKSAEDAMKLGRFTTAIARYETAEQVAPNNAMVLLGKAHAELGGGYYERAELDLRRAMAAEPALLVGQYNLRAMYGEQRLQFVINDLKQLASKDPKLARPVLLLAYVAYNTGNEDNASEWLQAAEDRGMKNDALIGAFRKNWKLPAK
jgi:tetratricopeptide (TPR) repeat protein